MTDTGLAPAPSYVQTPFSESAPIEQTRRVNGQRAQRGPFGAVRTSVLPFPTYSPNLANK
jgi:hypothetical protein